MHILCEVISFKMKNEKNKPLILTILDGFGIGDKSSGDAIFHANIPFLDSVLSSCHTTLLKACGLDVGLPDGQMGNSEVGHTNIGAGRIVYQDLTYINKCIEDSSFYKNKKLVETMRYAAKNDVSLHLMGLLSDGGVHSHINHLYALLEVARSYHVNKVCIHVWLDGRDTSPDSGVGYIESLKVKIKKLGIGRIETISGRFYAMDRDNRWDRTAKAYDAMANAKRERFKSPVDFVHKSYECGTTDEFVLPAVRQGYKGMAENDAVICFNFRPDRARQITRAFVDKNLNLDCMGRIFPQKYACFTEYDKNIPNLSVIFKPRKLENTFGEYISKQGLKQLRIAETEKYAHVTFFFNGGKETPYDNEDRIIIPSPKVAIYDQKPKMSAYEITEKVIEIIKQKKYDVIIINYANADMVGHTGNFEATVKAIETVDKCVKQLANEVKNCGGVMIITADHGNAERMKEKNGNVFTAHTTNLVPFSILNYPCELKNSGRLCDIAATMLQILGLEIPAEMTGESLII